MVVPTYEVDLGHSFFQLCIQGDCELDLNLLKQTIPGVLGVHQVQKNENQVLVYEFTGLVNVKDQMEAGTITMEWFTWLFQGILSVLSRVEEYLLLDCNFILNPEFIYISRQERTCYLCYYPGYQKPVREQFMELIEQCLKEMDYKDGRFVEFMYRLYRTVKEEGSTYEQIQAQFTAPGNELTPQQGPLQAEAEELPDKGRTLQTVETETEELYYPKISYIRMGFGVAAGLAAVVAVLQTSVIKNKTTGQLDWIRVACVLMFFLVTEAVLYLKFFDASQKSSRIQVTRTKEKEIISAKVPTQQIKPESYDIREETERTEILTGSGEQATQVLTTQALLLLVPKDESARIIVVNQPVFSIGTLKKEVDYCFTETVISRRHARISYHDGLYFVEDLESTNGTFVNGYLLKPGNEVELKQGDTITFANLAYDVKESFEETVEGRQAV